MLTCFLKHAGKDDPNIFFVKNNVHFASNLKQHPYGWIIKFSHRVEMLIFYSRPNNVFIVIIHRNKTPGVTFTDRSKAVVHL